MAQVSTSRDTEEEKDKNFESFAYNIFIKVRFGIFSIKANCRNVNHKFTMGISLVSFVRNIFLSFLGFFYSRKLKGLAWMLSENLQSKLPITLYPMPFFNECDLLWWMKKWKVDRRGSSFHAINLLKLMVRQHQISKNWFWIANGIILVLHFFLFWNGLPSSLGP